MQKMPEHWLQTYTGKVFEPLNPKPEQVCIEDIAQSLSMMCRYNGHLQDFYSVAQHSIIASQIVPPEFALEALLHDATEAYIGDMPSPIKRGQPSFSELEQNIWDKAIAPHFGLNAGPLSPEVKKADLEMLALEKKYLVVDYGYDWRLDGVKTPDKVLIPVSQNIAKQMFMMRFGQLYDQSSKS